MENLNFEFCNFIFVEVNVESIDMIFYTVFFMHVVSISLCFDLELEGAVRLGKDFLRRIGSVASLSVPPLKSPPPNHSSVQLMAFEPDSKPVLRNYMDQGADKVAIGDDISSQTSTIFKLVDKKYEIMSKPTENPAIRIVEVHNNQFRFNLKHQLSKQGSLRLKMLAFFIKNNVNSQINVNPVLNNATNNFLAEVKSYYNFISQKTVKYEIDKEFIVLDMIESTNKMLLNTGKHLLNAIIEESNADNSSNIDMPMLMKKIENTVLEEKKENLRHVCKVLDICRAFPGYSDKIADLISEILQLTDNKFHVIVKNLNTTITTKQDFFKKILREIVLVKISSRLSSSLNNLSFMREVFSITRAVITQRYKVFKSDNTEIKLKTKAVRILLDLIDKAFDVNDDEISSMEIDYTIDSYKQWAAGERDDVDIITKKFIYNAIEILNYNWSDKTKEEVKVLTDVIAIGTTKNEEVYDYLFTKGSAFIRNEDLQTHSDVD